MSNTIYSQEQLQTMNTIQLLSIAKSLLIPAGANWTDKQIIPVIDYYQKHSKKKQNTFLKWLCKNSTLQMIFILTAMVGIIYSKMYKNCPTGLCHVIETKTQSNSYDFSTELKIADAVSTISQEFVTAAQKSNLKFQKRYNQLKISLNDSKRMYQICQRKINDPGNYLVIIGLNDQLEQCWAQIEHVKVSLPYCTCAQYLFNFPKYSTCLF
eukprot:537375_1